MALIATRVSGDYMALAAPGLRSSSTPTLLTLEATGSNVSKIILSEIRNAPNALGSDIENFLTTEVMNESKSRIVHVDATIELKDYFHAFVDAAKTKLIIACLIVAIVIAAFTYFFILIDEQKILWELAPLFFGLPIVAIVGQFLRIHAEYRKYLADLSEAEKNVHFIFQEKGDGFDIVRGKNFGHIAWESVRGVVERPRYFRFVLANQTR